MKTARLFADHFDKLVFGGDRLSELYFVARAFDRLDNGFLFVLKLESHQRGLCLVEPLNKDGACVQEADIDLRLILALLIKDGLL